MRTSLISLGAILLALPLAAQEAAVPPTKAKPAATQGKQDDKKPVQIKVGDKIPANTTLHDIDGKRLRARDLTGKTVVVHFWSIVCPYEEQAEPKLMAIANDYKDKDVVVLAVNANAGEIGKAPAAEEFEAEKDQDKPYANIRAHTKSVEFNHRILMDHDGSFARLLAGRTTPHCFVFDGKGVMRYSGALDDDPRGKKGDDATNYVRVAVDAVMAGKAVETAETKPYG